MGNISAWKTWTWHPHTRSKGGVNKGGVYNSAYILEADCNKKSDR